MAAAGGRQTWIIWFLDAVSRFKLFDQSEWAQLCRSKDKQVLHNPGCQVWCIPRRCSRLKRCNNCAEPMDNHLPGPWRKPARCAGCHGPHRAGENGCPAAPWMENGRLAPKSARSLKKIRQTGQLAWKAAQEVKAAQDQIRSEMQDRQNADAPIESIEVSTQAPAATPEAILADGPSISAAATAAQEETDGYTKVNRSSQWNSKPPPMSNVAQLSKGSLGADTDMMEDSE